jgi:alcohol dehydrogenase class IV
VVSGISLGATSMAIHHKLCHTLGGTFNLAHADVTRLLPHAIATTATRRPTRCGPSPTPSAHGTRPKAFRSLGARGAARLKDIGMPADGAAADLAI